LVNKNMVIDRDADIRVVKDIQHHPNLVRPAALRLHRAKIPISHIEEAVNKEWPMMANHASTLRVVPALPG
jgi:hypothetical protein